MRLLVLIKSIHLLLCAMPWMSVLNIYAVYVFENFYNPPKNHLKFPFRVKKIEDFFVFFLQLLTFVLL